MCICIHGHIKVLNQTSILSMAENNIDNIQDFI